MGRPAKIAAAIASSLALVGGGFAVAPRSCGCTVNAPEWSQLGSISGTTTQGQVLTYSGASWHNSPTSFSEQWEDCDALGANCSYIAGATSSTYTLAGSDVGHTIRVVETASNASGKASSSSSPSATVASNGVTAIQVGAPSPAGVTCTTTLNAGANVNNALTAAAAGSTVCLNAGSWGNITLSGQSHASTVTLAATPGQTVTLPEITLQSGNSNLTVEGFYVTAATAQGGAIVGLGGSTGGVVLQYNTLENQPKNDGIYFATGTWTGTTVQYNQIDHDGGGVASNTNTPNLLVAHNVVGPDIGFGDTDQAHDEQHYLQLGGPNLSVDHNAFIGPYDDNAIATTGVHNNVLHSFNGNTGISFTNNIMWHTHSMGSASVLLEDQLTNVVMNNNLDVEDPVWNALNYNCEPASPTTGSCWTLPFEAWGPHGEQFENNTIVNAGEGLDISRVAGDSFTDPNNITVTGNIVAPTPVAIPSGDYNIYTCTSACSTSNNVSGDGSANSKLGGTGNVVNWTTNWQNTTWTPTVGPPWSQPPQNYYQPVTGGGVTSSMGWQGSICTASIRTNCIGP